MTLSGVTKSLLQSILDWVRAGYPEGVPGPDRVPLLALLQSTELTDDQVKEVVGHITAAESAAPAGHTIDRDEIAHFIGEYTAHDATEENVRRVAAKLAAAGWPLAGVDAAKTVGAADTTHTANTTHLA
jgi:Protein of unknown function (DUF3349)